MYVTGTKKLPSQRVFDSCNEGDFFSSRQPAPQPGIPAWKQPRDPTLLYRTAVDLTVFTAAVKVELDKKLSAELLRSTKKEPPSRLTYDLVYVSAFN